MCARSPSPRVVVDPQALDRLSPARFPTGVRADHKDTTLVKGAESLRRGFAWTKERGWERRIPPGSGDVRPNTRRIAPATTAAALASVAVAARTTSSGATESGGGSARAGAGSRGAAGAVSSHAHPYYADRHLPPPPPPQAARGREFPHTQALPSRAPLAHPVRTTVSASASGGGSAAAAGPPPARIQPQPRSATAASVGTDSADAAAPVADADLTAEYYEDYVMGMLDIPDEEPPAVAPAVVDEPRPAADTPSDAVAGTSANPNVAAGGESASREDAGGGVGAGEGDWAAQQGRSGGGADAGGWAGDTRVLLEENDDAQIGERAGKEEGDGDGEGTAGEDGCASATAASKDQPCSPPALSVFEQGLHWTFCVFLRSHLITLL